MSNVDLFALSLYSEPVAWQTIERRIAQGRDQLALCTEEGQRLGRLDREIKREQNAYKGAMVSLCTLVLGLVFTSPLRLTLLTGQTEST